MSPIIPFDYLVLLGGILLLAGGYLAWNTAARARRRDRIIITILRIAALAGLLFVALNPGRWQREREEHPDRWAILIDDSRSMGVEDVDGASRLQAAVSIARDASKRIEDEGGDALVYSFSERLKPIPVEGLEALAATGEASDILLAGDALLARHQAGSGGLKGIMLLSDGRQTSREARSDFAVRARARRSPVYPIVLGGDVLKKDISIVPARRHYVAFAGQAAKVGAVVRAQGYGRISPTVRLLDADGKVIEERKLELEDDSERRLSFRIRPEAAGYHKYGFEIDAWETDSTPANNRAEIGISAVDDDMRVLFLEGVPFWDSKFAVQLLRNQAHMKVDSIYRLAADRYFRIGSDTEDTSESDRPIFPENIEELSRYDIIVIGRGAEYFLDEERIGLIRVYLREQGGCLLFARGKSYNGSFPALEPLEPVVWGDRLKQSIVLEPASAGADAGLFGDLLPAPGDAVWEGLPRLREMRACRDIKSFSRILATGIADGESRKASPSPLIVSRRFGKGMVVLINAEGLWHWDFFPVDEKSGEIYKDLWVQLIHWMATYSEYLPGQEFALHMSDSSILPGSSVRLRIGYRGREEFEGNPVVLVRREDELLQSIAAAKSSSERNRWDAVLRLEQPGGYRIGIADSGGQSEAAVYKTLFVLPLPSETDELGADRQFLQQLAESSGGHLIDNGELGDILAPNIEEQAVAETDRAVWVPLWDKLWILLAISALFLCEWFLRRRNGLI